MIFAGIAMLVICVALGWWARPIGGIVSPRIKGYDYYVSGAVFWLLIFGLIFVGAGVTFA